MVSELQKAVDMVCRWDIAGHDALIRKRVSIKEIKCIYKILRPARLTENNGSLHSLEIPTNAELHRLHWQAQPLNRSTLINQLGIPYLPQKDIGYLFE